MRIKVIEQVDGAVFYACEGSAYRLEVTEAMCSLSLGEEKDELHEHFSHGYEPVQRMEKVWVHPEPDCLTEEEAATIASEHHQLAIRLTQSELDEFGQYDPQYFLFIR